MQSDNLPPRPLKYSRMRTHVTCGKGMDNAIFMAKDLLYYMLTEAPKQCLPPSKVEELEKEYPGQTIVFIEVEIEEVVDC